MAKLKTIKSITPVLQLEIYFPDKKYFTIGEVSEICALKPHVLRYWEKVFPQLEPSKRSGRRYYQKSDLELLHEIKSLLQNQGFTISGAKARLAKGKILVDVVVFEDKSSVLSKLSLMREELKKFQDYLS